MEKEVNGVLLDIRELKTYFYTDQGVVKAVDNVNLTIAEGETICLVGESGCGKSITALSVMGLIPQPPGRIAGGQIVFNGVNLIALSEKEMRRIRGNQISMIFQEPMTSLNPVFTVGDQISETLRIHKGLSKKESFDRSAELLKQVGIPSPEKRIHDYPHQMSGGMRQRVMIAMALACSPRLIIADEPTTALDVTIQAQILELMDNLSRTTGTAMLLITHDLGVVAETAERVIVMYAGRIVESAEVADLFRNPLHPYTQGLMRSIPGAAAVSKNARLETIPGVVPSLLNLPSGCKFHDRCRLAFDICRQHEPDLKQVIENHFAKCWLYSR